MKTQIARYCILFFVFLFAGNLFAQTKPDSSSAADTSKKNIPTPAAVIDTLRNNSTVPASAQPASSQKVHSVIEMEFVKEKSLQGVDSAFFNVLKISNNNGAVVNGTVKITVPLGWKLLSQEETTVSIQAGGSEYIPVRVSLARNSIGGVSYLVTATLSSNRVIFPDKNQTSVSKSCYVTVPKKSKWEVYPLQHTVYFNHYSEYTPFMLNISNHGNGIEVVKIDMQIGNGLEMYGALGNRHFTSIEVKPHTDSIISFPIRYIPPDESVFWSRDLRTTTVRITATVDSTSERTSVTYKYLESSFNNLLSDQAYPLNIEVQAQNLLSDFAPRLYFGADGKIFFKNDDVLDYYARFYTILFSYQNTADFAEQFWLQSHFRAHYNAGKWQVSAGDVGMTGVGMIGLGYAGRGIAGSYRINNKHTVGGSLTASVYRTIFSGNVYHETMLPKHIALASGLNFIYNDYNKMNTFGAAVKATYPFLPGHRVSLSLAGTETQHLYSNQTFTYPNGSFITTNDPGKTFYGLGTQLDYSLKIKKATATLTARYASKHFSQYYNGRIWVFGTGRYVINKKYYLLGNVNYNQQDPQIYNQGILFPKNEHAYGRYSAEFADIINSKLTLFAGPVFDHAQIKRLKILPNGDSVYTRFATASPKLLLKAHLRNSVYSSVSVFSTFGFTYITQAYDPTLPSLPFNYKAPFFNTNTGVNILQKNWGINISYFTGPYSSAMQTDYYNTGNYSRTIRIMPYFQRYFFRRKMLLTSHNSYYFQSRSNMESIALNARISYFFPMGWTLFVDNNLFMTSRINDQQEKIYSRQYGLNLGFRKSFDFPQPSVKYQDIRIMCFKDINGNGVMDANEHGLSDIVIGIDRQSGTDSLSKLPKKLRGQFTATEMVTDNFGQVIYYHIPQGDYSLNVIPMMNLKDIFNVKGQKQSIKVLSDSIYYIPFSQSYRVMGHVILKRDEFSSAGNVSLGNIRVTATDSSHNNFPALTAGDGSYTLYVPQSGEYHLTCNNVFGDQFTLQDGDYTVEFNGAKEFMVDFIFVEKKRPINIGGKPSSLDSLLNRANGKPDTTNKITGNKPVADTTKKKLLIAGKDTLKNITTVTDTGSSAANGKAYFYSIPVGPGISYRVQIAASSTRIPASQFSKRFPGVKDVKEYKEGNIYKYTAGDFFAIGEVKNTKEALLTKGYKGAFIVPFYKNQRIQYK